MFPSKVLQAPKLPVLPHCSLYAGDLNSPHTDWKYSNTNTLNWKCLAKWAGSINLALLYNPKDQDRFHSDRWNTSTNPNLAFAALVAYLKSVF